MRRITGKRYFQAPRFASLRDLLQYCVSRYGNQPAFRYHHRGEDAETVVTFRQYLETINNCGTGLLALGLKNAHVGIIGFNCFQWAVAHNAIINGVGVSVPMDRLLPIDEVVNLCARGNLSALIYHEKQRDIALAVAAANPDIRYFICMFSDNHWHTASERDPRFLDLQDIILDGETRRAQGDDSFTGAEINPEAMCYLLFTSGTSMAARGVMLCHRNITHNIYAVMGTLNVSPGQNALSVLPLHHTFENTVGMFMIHAYGCCICYSDGLRRFLKNLSEWQISILIAVPLVFETSYKQIMKILSQKKKLAQVAFTRRLAALLRKIGLDIRRRVFRRLIATAFGGHLKLCICGAAPIDKKIVRFYNQIGIDFYCGYGLTETSPVISVCNSFVNRYGSVGPPVADIEVAIDGPAESPYAAGEILTRSDSVMLGYYENQDETKRVITEDGWFRTGDLGYIDKHECIFITGRLKSMIVLNNGKKAFPEEIEALLNSIDGVRESFVWGEKTGRGIVEICARIIPDQGKLPASVKSDAGLLIPYMDDKITAINKMMPPYKEIRYFFISAREPVKTTGMALKRNEEIEAIAGELAVRGLDIASAHKTRID